MHVHIHTHTCIHIFMYTYTYTYTYIHTWIHIHTHTHIHVQIHIYIYICLYTHIYRYIYIYRICTSCREREAKMYADVHNSCPTYTPAHAWCATTPVNLNACRLFAKKCIWTCVCAPIQLCSSFFTMEAIANLSWVLREHRADCQTYRPLSCCVARRCSLKKSVQIHAISWRGHHCSVAQASSDHPRWCRPHPVCL